MIAFRLVLHHRRGGLSRITGQDRSYATVGAPRSAVEARPAQSLLVESCQFGHHTWISIRIQGCASLSAEAFENDEQDVRTIGLQQCMSGASQRIGSVHRKSIQFGKGLITLLISHEAIHLVVILLLTQRIEERKDGIDSRLVKIHLGREICPAHIHRAFAHSSTDTEENDSRKQQTLQRVNDSSSKWFGTIGACLTPQVAMTALR